MLIESFNTPCVRMLKQLMPDDEGGISTQWIEGAQFNAAIVRDTTMAAKIAEKDGMTNLYTVTVDPSDALMFHDVFKRLKDGQIFRVTSDGDDMQTPSVASFDFMQVSAEEWEPPNDN